MTYAQMHPAMQRFYDFQGKRTPEERQAALEAAWAEVEADKDWTTPPAAGPCHGDRTHVTEMFSDTPQHNV